MLPFPRRPRDPHAHCVHAPRARLFAQVPLRALRLQAPARRPQNAAVSVVSLLDLMVGVVLFLLTQFHAPVDCGCVDRPLPLPWAENVDDVIDAPMVAVNGAQILVDGVQAGSAREVAEEGRMVPLPELTTLLRNKRELWRQVQPGKPFPGVVLLQIEQRAPAVVVKSVFRAAVRGGYPNVSFMVRKLEAKG